MPNSNMTLVIDGYNFLHRSRSGFQGGEWPVVYNFFRGLRALVDMHKPTKVYFVLEGIPRQRLALMPEYKANRVIDEANIKAISAYERFVQQKRIIIAALQESFPLIVTQHPDFECDDVIYNLIKRDKETSSWIVASNDSDFVQLLNEFDNVRIYNPMLKTYVEKPGYDYVTWKSLRGDGSDNIPGIPGVGNKTANDLMTDPEAMKKFFGDTEKGAMRTEIFNHAYSLIKFHTWSDEDASGMMLSEPKAEWERVQALFKMCGFSSMLKEPAWTKFTSTFNKLMK